MTVSRKTARDDVEDAKIDGYTREVSSYQSHFVNYLQEFVKRHTFQPNQSNYDKIMTK